MSELINSWNAHAAGNSSNQPIIFLHGFMGSGRIWIPTMHQIAASTHCIALDLPGHGMTEANLDQLDFDTLADEIIRFLDDNVQQTPLIIGYSLGGRVALHTALKYPDRFCGLVLESASPGIEDEAERVVRFASDTVWAEKLRQNDMRSFLTDWYRQPVFSYMESDMIKRIINKKSSNDPHQLAEIMMRLSQGRQLHLWEKLSAWDKPTQLITGELDVKYCKILERMASLMPNSSLAIIPGAGHIVHLEQNKDFIRVLNSFLSSYIL